MKRRGFIAAATGLLVVREPFAQVNSIDPYIWAVTKGALVRKGRVKLELPILADNGNSVTMKVGVDSPMSAGDYVKSIHLFSERNPVPNMANFYLGPRAGRAEIVSRVRLAGSQRVTALAATSDGNFWSDTVSIVVTLSACIDES
jgi:sulfur-oxidizing protein SoxY